MTHSAGIVLWRIGPSDPPAIHEPIIELLLAHPGGPFWASKDEHAWSIPKGEFDPDHESPWDAARREYEEELGVAAPVDGAVTIPPFRAGKKILHAWAVAGDFDPATIRADDEHRSTVQTVWPPRSKTLITFPEVDRVAWVGLDEAPSKLHKGQAPLVEAIRRCIADGTITLA